MATFSELDKICEILP